MWQLKRLDSDLDSSCVALQAPDGTAALVEGRLRLGVRRNGFKAHAHPQGLRHLLDERGAGVGQSLRNQTGWKVKGQRQRLQVLGVKATRGKERMRKETSEATGPSSCHLDLSSHRSLSRRKSPRMDKNAALGVSAWIICGPLTRILLLESSTPSMGPAMETCNKFMNQPQRVFSS